MFEVVRSFSSLITVLALCFAAIGFGVFIYSVVFQYNPKRIAASVASVAVGVECLLYALPASWLF